MKRVETAEVQTAGCYVKARFNTCDTGRTAYTVPVPIQLHLFYSGASSHRLTTYRTLKPRRSFVLLTAQQASTNPHQLRLLWVHPAGIYIQYSSRLTYSLNLRVHFSLNSCYSILRVTWTIYLELFVVPHYFFHHKRI